MNLLVVDKASETKLQIESIAGKSEHELYYCESGIEAMEILHGENIQCAVIGRELADGRGIDLASRIRSDIQWEEVHLIQLVETCCDEILEAIDTGVNDCLTLPICPAEFRWRIRSGQHVAELRSRLAHAQKLSSVGELAAGIFHEINTPLQYVGDNTRFIRDACQSFSNILAEYEKLLNAVKSSESTDDIIQRIEVASEMADLSYLIEEAPFAIEQSLHGVDRVACMVRAMKEFSHPGNTEKMPIDLHEAIRNTLMVARNEWKYVSDIEFDLDDELPRVPCLSCDINQVLLNIIVNAAHAIGDVVGEGGAKGTITISTTHNEDYVNLRIADTGTGIAEKHLAKIFDPFYTTKGIGKGSGQGLAIARSVIVNKHGGKIEVDTDVGKGTTFSISLPRLDSANATAAKHCKDSLLTQ